MNRTFTLRRDFGEAVVVAVLNERVEFEVVGPTVDGLLVVRVRTGEEATVVGFDPGTERVLNVPGECEVVVERVRLVRDFDGVGGR